MQRVESNGQWSFFCPDRSKDLMDLWGDDFTAAYQAYEEAGKAVKSLPAREVWMKTLTTIAETGQPSLIFSDTSNRCNAQMNLGTLRSSNLCTEVLLYNNHEEIATCVLASIAVNRFVDVEKATFDFDKLVRV